MGGSSSDKEGPPDPKARAGSIKRELSEDRRQSKRQKLTPSTPNTAGAQSRRETFLARLRSQVIPHVIRAVQELPTHGLKHDAIAAEAASILGKDPRYRSLLGDDSGLLTPDDGVSTAQRAADVVHHLSLLSEYRIENCREDATLLIKEEPLASRGIGTVPAFPTPTPMSAPKSTNIPRRKPWKPRVRRASSTQQSTRKWMHLTSRPYLSHFDREAIRDGTQLTLARAKPLCDGPVIYHVDFSAAEISSMIEHMMPYVQFDMPRTTVALQQLCAEYPVSTLLDGKLPGRTEQDVRSFCSDLLSGNAADSRNANILSIRRDVQPQEEDHRRQSSVSSMLFARELEGHAGFGRTRRYVNFQSAFKEVHEDSISLSAEFTNCAGDISTMAWVPGQNILCGTTAHSDAHNQQYNKQGNLLLCSVSEGMLRAFPDHRIPRPIVSKGENSSDAMRQSQEPWVYSSVVSSDYDKNKDIAYTSSFDRTMKAWKIRGDGTSMEAVASFQHTGNVNFVVAAKDGSGRVATAADVSSEAVRVYTMNPDNLAESSYYTISCSRTDADDSDKWGYCPATIQWGIATGSQHLLLIGYSPRSFSNDEQDIPVDKQQTGEIMLWDANERRPVPVLTATTANVFEVMWHPTVCGFVVGTSPCGLHVDQGIHTQIHVFRPHPEDDAYSEFQKLDCPALDINELTITPNSLQSSYITAACTDGKVYVWDMSQGDKPIHVLQHGKPLDEVLRPEDREREDTGVKFTAWGSGLTRLYTGASDGVVKVWNIRNRRKPFVRDLLRAPGPISCGGFSPDRSRLAIGDATGRLFLFSVNHDEKLEEKFNVVLPGTKRRVRRPQPFTPHPEPPPPTPADDAMSDDEDDAATYTRKRFLDTQQVRLHPNPVIGAVQGARYVSSGLFLRDAHLDDDPALPLVTRYERLQQASRHSVLGSSPEVDGRRRLLRRMRAPPADFGAAAQHRANAARDLDVRAALDAIEVDELVRAGALLDIGEEGEDWGFAYEDVPGEADEEYL